MPNDLAIIMAEYVAAERAYEAALHAAEQHRIKRAVVDDAWWDVRGKLSATVTTTGERYWSARCALMQYARDYVAAQTAPMVRAANEVQP